MLKYIFCFSLFIITIFPLYSTEPVSVQTFFTNQEIEKVKTGEIITRMYLKNNAVGENTNLKIEIPKTVYKDEDFSLYEMITDEKAFFPYNMEDDDSKLKFYNILTSYSKLSGMKYFSRRISEVKELIIDSYRIESPKKKKAIKDMVYKEIKPKVVNYFLQKDNKFGNLSYKSELFNEGDNFILINTCLDPVSKYFFSINKKEEYKLLTYFIYDKKLKGFFYYSVNLMRIRLKLLLTKNKKLTLFPTTFSNRLRAATVHLALLIGLNWEDKLNPWDEKFLKMLRKGKHEGYYQ